MILIVIPARLKSSRLEKKLLKKIKEHPLLWWTWQIAQKSKLAQKSVIATDSQEISKSLSNYGAEVILTSTECSSGTQRVFEALQKFPQAEIIVNLQGDEPLMPVQVIDRVIKLVLSLKKKKIPEIIVTAATKFKSVSQKEAKSNVKVVFNQESKRAVYFSRANLAGSLFHLGIYAFNRAALERYAALQTSFLEQAEKLEQLKALENFMPIYLEDVSSILDLKKQEHFGIDTLEEFNKAKAILEN